MKSKRWIVGKWSWLSPFKLAVLTYLTLLVVSLSFSNKLIFLPPPAQYAETTVGVRILDPGEKQVACIYHPPMDDEPVLLWAHGNAEDIGHLNPLFLEFHAQGFGVLGYDYPGYGHSAGSPGERSCYRAAQRAYHFLTVDQNIEPTRIILLGQSVGSGPACWLAEHHETGGLILIAPFLSAFRALTHYPIIPGDKFKNLKRIKKIKEPLLVIHGSSDEAIPYRQGRRLYQEHGGPKEFLEVRGAGHNDIWGMGREEMVNAIKKLARIP